MPCILGLVLISSFYNLTAFAVYLVVLLRFFEILLVVCTVSTVKTTIIEKTIIAIEKRTMYSIHMICTFRIIIIYTAKRLVIISLYNSSISLSNKNFNN